jgi:hypothetical protein
MITPESLEEHLKEDTVRNNLKRHIKNELAGELEEQGLLDQLLKNRIYGELINLTNEGQEDNKPDINTRICRLAKDWYGVEIDRRYLEKKESYEKVSFRLFRNKNKGIALEMYQRLSNGEQSWEIISEQWGEKPEKDYGGKYNPTSAKKISKELRGILRRLQPGQLSEPELLGKFYTIAETIEWEQVELNEELRSELEREMLDDWVIERTNELKREIIELID